jgi:hypothetical protein
MWFDPPAAGGQFVVWTALDLRAKERLEQQLEIVVIEPDDHFTIHSDDTSVCCP